MRPRLRPRVQRLPSVPGQRAFEYVRQEGGEGGKGEGGKGKGEGLCNDPCYAAHSTPWSTKCEVGYSHGYNACPECKPSLPPSPTPPSSPSPSPSPEPSPKPSPLPEPSTNTCWKPLLVRHPPTPEP